MTGWALVAIPQEESPVWKLSSEKVPHMTILYFGEQSDGSLASHIVSFAEYCAKLVLPPFGMNVESRGVLGEDEADVLFFEKDFGYNDVLAFRKYLLQDANIRKAYETVEQYPEWTPHLTLGYPNAPAKKNVLDYPINYIPFHKIALWTEDFSGFEIPLKYQSLSVVSMSNTISLEEALEHYGVKGMRWGVRKSSDSGVSRSTNREAKKDAEEFARAKMFYGQGAGTRRKLIKATVEAKSKKDPSYKKAFDQHLTSQDMSTHASKARSERRRKDAVEKTYKTSKGVYRYINGGFGAVSMVSAIIASGYIAASKTGIDKVIKDSASKKVRDLKNNRQGQKMVNDLLKSMNLS